MPVRLDHEKQGWVKVPAPPPKKPRPKYINRAEEREALCARLRYFACQSMDSRDRIRMLNRPVKRNDNMVEPDRAPSPVPDQWTGAGLMFQNGARGGGGSVDRRNMRRFRERGFDMESEDEDAQSRARSHRVVSEPAKATRARSRSRARTVVEDDLIEVIEEPSIINDDVRSHRSYRSRKSRHHNHQDEIHVTKPQPAEDTRSYRSASPPPPQAPSVYSRRQREPAPPPPHAPQSSWRPQARHVTAPATARAMPSSTPVSSSYQFQSAIFRPKESANHYRSVYEKRNKDGSVGPGSWASATSALSFD